MDNSGSICRTAIGCLEWIHMINFLLILVKYMGLSQDDTHVSVAFFSEGDQLDTCFRLDIRFNQFSDFDNFLATVSDIRYEGWRYDAPTWVLQRSLTDMFTVGNGWRDDVPSTVIFLTDGGCEGTLCPCGQIDLEGVSRDFLNRDIELIAIGIGVNVDTELLEWLTGPHGHLRLIDEFEALYNPDFALQLDMCQGSRTLVWRSFYFFYFFFITYKVQPMHRIYFYFS